MKVHFRLSPDGRALWSNYQRTDAITVTSDWTGEWIRTTDGALLGQYRDSAFDWGAVTTSIDPLNRRGYLSRQGGAVQGVPVPNALASVSPAQFEIVGGNASTATFRMLRTAESDQFYNVSATGIDLGQSFVSIPTGTRDASITTVPRPVSTATDGTITVTDSFGTVSTRVHIVPPHLVSATLSPASIQGGQTASLMLTLDGPAPAGGRTITLVSTKPSLMAPASVTLPEGANAITISIPSSTVTKTTPITLTARLDAAKIKMTITLTP